MPKALQALLLATCVLLAAATPVRAQNVDQEAVHVLSLRVMSNNQEVMSPVVHVAAGASASVAIVSSDGSSYTLVTTVRPPATKEAPNTGGVDVSLWNGEEGTGVRMIEGRVSAGGARVVADEQSTTVELISHAIYRKAPNDGREPG